MLLVTATSAVLADVVTQADDQLYFRRISTFNICEQIDPTCNTDIATNAETVWYYENKNDNTFRLVYTNSESENLGFVDISDPTSPKAIGEVPLGGEPTTVRVIGNYGTFLSLFSLLTISLSFCVCLRTCGMHTVVYVVNNLRLSYYTLFRTILFSLSLSFSLQ